MLVCVWYLITCYLPPALCMRDSKMMETSPACKNTQTDNTSQMKKKKSVDAFIWPWINGSYKVCSVFTEHILGLWDIKHREKNFESHLNMESSIVFSERKSKQRAVIWTCSGVRWRVTSNALRMACHYFKHNGSVCLGVAVFLRTLCSCNPRECEYWWETQFL